MKRGGRDPEKNNGKRRNAPGGIPTGQGLGVPVAGAASSLAASAAGGAPAPAAPAPAPAPAAPASLSPAPAPAAPASLVVRRKTSGPRLGGEEGGGASAAPKEGGGGGGGGAAPENDPLRDLKRFSQRYNAVMHLLSGSLDATATVLRSLDGLAGTVAESAKNRLVQVLKATGSGVMGVASVAARAAPTVGAAVGAALKKFSKFVSSKEAPMTAFRLYMTLDPMRHGLAYNAEQPDALRRFLDVRVLAMDKASLKMEDLATRQFALAVNQYLQQPYPIFADNVIKAFIYWRSVVNYHKVQKEVTLGSTAGIMVIPRNTPHSISGVPLIRPPSIITWGGKPIAEFDIQDANIVLAILKSGSPELTAYMCQALQIRGADELTPEHIMKPSKWTPRLAAGAEAAAAAGNSGVVKALIQELTNIPKETEKIGQLDAAASHGQLGFLEREGLFTGVNGNVGSEGGLGGVDNNRGLGSYKTPAGTQEGEAEAQAEKGLMELVAEEPATEVKGGAGKSPEEGGAAAAGGGGGGGGGASSAGGGPRRRLPSAQAGGRRSKRKHTAKKQKKQNKQNKQKKTIKKHRR